MGLFRVCRPVLVVFALAVARTAGAQTGSISGQVTGPVATTVAVYTATAQLADATFVATADTDFSTHQYVVSGLAPGTYFVRTAAPNDRSFFVDQWYPAIAVAANGVRPQGVTVAAGGTTSGINFALTDVSGSISGSLTLARLPFTGQVTLPVVNVYNEDGFLVHTPQLSATPGATAGSPITADPPAGGTFTWSVVGLPSGRYYVKTSNPAQSAPNNGHVGSSGGWWVDEVYDNITCVAADCSPSRGTPITVTAGANGSGGSAPSAVNMSLDYGAQITGGVLAPTFLATIRVEIYDSRGVRLPGRSTPSAFGSAYFANGLPSGSYFLKLLRDPQGKFPEELYKDQPCNGCAVTSGTPVTVVLGETRNGIDFSGLPSQAIKGTVRTGGSPAAQVTVEIFTPTDARLGSTTTAADGTYTLAGLNPGALYLRTVNTAGFVDAVYQNQSCPNCDALQGTAVTVTAGADTTGVDFDLVLGSTLSGLVQADPGPAAGFSIAPVTGVGVTIYTSQGAPAGTAVSDRSGRFTVTLPNGTYVASTNAEAGFRRKLYSNKDCPSGPCDLSTGTPIPMVVLPVTGVDFTLPQCAAPSISPVTLANAAVGRPYRQTLAYSAGPPSGAFTVKSGVLPPGLALDRASGVLSGTPTASGAFTFTVAAETADCAGARTYTLDVPACVFNAPLVMTVPAAGTGSLLGQSCTGSWTVTADQPWIHSSRTQTTTPGPGNTSTIEQASITVDANGSASARAGHITLGSRSITVFQSGTTMSAPFGVLESPANGAVVNGSIAVTGWALDDLDVSNVSIYRDPIAGEGAAQIFVGTATFVTGARPDVEAAYPSIAERTRAGWGYLLLTNMLPAQGNGTFNLYAYASDADGNRVLLGTRTITATNSSATTPFGAIDTPDQGATISGSNSVNFGWALTPQPKMIPFDGSTIRVIIDGVAVGPVTSYNLARSDVSGLFPGLKNSGGPVGYRVIDTTALSEGVHTIAWVATDDAGKATGIGSRYFTVQNSAWLPSLKTASVLAVPPAFTAGEVGLADRTTAVPPRIDGADLGRHAASLAGLPAGTAAGRTIELHPLQRLELPLATHAGDDACAPTFDGYLSANDELRPLPTGSSLDRSGTFYWQPGPGFLGVYRLVFVRTACDGTRARIQVTVQIR